MSVRPKKRLWNESACSAAGRLAFAVEGALAVFGRSDDSALKALRTALREYDAEIMAMPLASMRRAKR